MQTATQEASLRHRDRIRTRLQRMGEKTLLRRAIRAIRWNRRHPQDAAGQLNRNLVWAELFCRGQQELFLKALSIVRRKEHQQHIQQAKKLRRSKPR